MAGDFLHLDRRDFAHTVRGVDHEITRGEQHLFGHHIIRLSHKPTRLALVQRPPGPPSGKATVHTSTPERGTGGRGVVSASHTYITNALAGPADQPCRPGKRAFPAATERLAG